MQRIVPHLWFEKEALEAAQFYASVFPDSKVDFTTQIKDTPSGDCDIVGFNAMGFRFMAISAGPMFKINPSISFHAKCATPAEVDSIWEKLLAGGKVLMELGEYPFSRRYGWIQDRYAVSWQLVCSEGDIRQRITPVLMFTGAVCGKAEEAARFYASVFPDSSATVMARYLQDTEPDQAGTVRYGQLVLGGQAFGVMDSAQFHDFSFNEAVSLMTFCRDQDEIDYFWERLSAVREAERCGWIKDKYGISWQILPANMGELMSKNPKQTTPAMLNMKKIVIADLERASNLD